MLSIVYIRTYLNITTKGTVIVISFKYMFKLYSEILNASIIKCNALSNKLFSWSL